MNYAVMIFPSGKWNMYRFVTPFGRGGYKKAKVYWVDTDGI